jgi:NAD-dependent dihydropyrimidine dehydrogenase PreA subunit
MMWNALLIFLAVLAAAVCAIALFIWFAGERGRFLGSTWRFLRQAGFGWNGLHGYIYARWTPRYVQMLLRQPQPSSSPKAFAAAARFADTYHGKVLTLEHARSIVTLDRKIRRDLEQIVPYPVARDIVLQGPPDVVAYECVCRNGRAAHCGPTQVCMVIGKPISDFMLEHQPESARRLTQAEALELLEEEHRRGHVHAAWFKDAMLNRFYAICNCCKCCCGGIGQMRQGVRMLAGSGYVAQFDAGRCADCGECVEACPFGALSKNGEGVARDWERCMGCGVCEGKCAAGAITLARDERKGIPLDVRAL